MGEKLNLIWKNLKIKKEFLKKLVILTSPNSIS